MKRPDNFEIFEIVRAFRLSAKVKHCTAPWLPYDEATQVHTNSYLRQYRTMGAAAFAGSFVPIVQCEKWEIHPVFPHFSHFLLGQNLSPKALAPLYGIALKDSISSEGILVQDKAEERRHTGCMASDDNEVLRQ